VEVALARLFWGLLRGAIPDTAGHQPEQ